MRPRMGYSGTHGRVRRARILDLVGWDGAVVLTGTHILHTLEVPIREGRHDLVPAVVERGQRAFDELDALR